MKKLFEYLKKNKIYRIILISLNIILVIALIIFGFIFLSGDNTVTNPGSMINIQKWETGAFGLIAILGPLFILNAALYLMIDVFIDRLKLMFFLPSAACLVLVLQYFLTSIFTPGNSRQLGSIKTITCNLNGKEYFYEIYRDGKGELSLGKDIYDRLKIEVDFTSVDAMTKSINEYFNNNNGSCE